MKLSILVATVPNRIRSFYPNIMEKLMNQIGDRKDIELIGLFDNKRRTVGAKRNDLLNMARGEFLVFIDDDDDVANDYIQLVSQAIEQFPSADCIVYDCITTINDDPNQTTYSQYSIHNEYTQWRDQNGKLQWRGKPAHTMVYRSSIAKAHKYPDQNYGEDVHYVRRASKDIKQEIKIDKVLYYYRFNSKVSETRG